VPRPDLEEQIGEVGEITVKATIYNRDNDDRWPNVVLVIGDRWFDAGWGQAEILADLLATAADAIANDDVFHHENEYFAIYADAERCQLRATQTIRAAALAELDLPPADVEELARLIELAYQFIQTYDELDTQT
jgi:hypothetical protein